VDCDPPVIDAASRGKVRTVVGAWLPFSVTAFDPGRSWSWSVAGVPATGHRIAAGPEGGTRVEFDVPWLAAPYLLVLSVGLRRLRRVAEEGSS
jgi:hypothetical protein